MTRVLVDSGVPDVTDLPSPALHKKQMVDSGVPDVTDLPSPASQERRLLVDSSVPPDLDLASPIAVSTMSTEPPDAASTGVEASRPRVRARSRRRKTP